MNVDPDLSAAMSPHTSGDELARIAAARPDLHVYLATNPATYPDLLEWLRLSADPDVQQALAARMSGSQAANVGHAAPDLQLSPSPRATVQEGGSGKRRRVGLVVSAALAVVALVTAGIFGYTKFFGAPAKPYFWFYISDAWAGGGVERWHLPPSGPDRSVQSFSLSEDDLLAVVERTEGQAAFWVTVYDVAGDEPEELWQKEMSHYPDRSVSGWMVGEWLNIGLEGSAAVLVDARTGASAPTSLKGHDEYVKIGDYLVGTTEVGDNYRTTVYDLEANELWQKTFNGKLFEYYSTYAGIPSERVESQVLVYAAPIGGSKNAWRMMDMDTGEEQPVDATNLGGDSSFVDFVDQSGSAVVLNQDGDWWGGSSKAVWISPGGEEVKSVTLPQMPEGTMYSSRSWNDKVSASEMLDAYANPEGKHQNISMVKTSGSNPELLTFSGDEIVLPRADDNWVSVASPSGKTVLIGSDLFSDDGAMRAISTRNGKAAVTWSSPRGVYAVQVGKDQIIAASEKDGLTCWEPAD